MLIGISVVFSMH